MESSNFYELLHQQLGSLSSLAAQSTPGVAPIHEDNPSLLLNINDYNRYMNEILPNSARNAIFPDMGYDEYESCPNQPTMLNAVDLNQNLWPSTTSNWACQDASSSNNHVFNGITIGSAQLGLSSASSLDSSHLAMNFTADNGESHPRSSKEDSSLCIHLNDSSFGQPSNSNKTYESRDRAISRTKRDISASSQRKPSQDEAAKKQKAVSQAPCSLPKVGKEKIGDRIAALHRLVAPFGKTDAASVLTEAIGYIQFLQHQIQTLSTPCIKPSLSDCRHFRRVASKVEHKQDLRSRGLCLVPLPIASYISSSFVGLDNNID